MLQVLGRPNSINVRKVLWLCHELELRCELHKWGTGYQSTATPEFLALNPNGKVPVISEGEFVLWESNTICRYLAAEHGRFDLLPERPRERALVEQWMDWQATELNNSWRYAFMALVRQSPAHKDQGAITASIQDWNRHMTMLDRQLDRAGGFVTDNGFSLADVVLGLSTHRWFMTPMERPALAAVSAYYERLSERPGYLLHGRNGIP